MKTKNVFTVLCFILLATATLKAQLLEESFIYPAGDSIGAHGWVHFSPSGTGTLNRVMVTTPGLEYPGYQISGAGNAATLTNTGQDLYRSFSSVQTGGSVYSFFIVKVDSARTTGDFFCSFLPSTSTANFLCRVHVKKTITSNTNFSFGLSKTTTSGGIQWSDSVYTKGTSYLLVMKYTFNSVSNTDDQVSLFIFSSGVPASEPTPTIGPITGTGADANDIGRLSLRQGSESIAPGLVIDEIFAGTSWGSTLPVELTSFRYEIFGRNVELSWSTSGEINNAGFEIQRRSRLSEIWNKLEFIKGNGTTDIETQYFFTDKIPYSGIYSYRLKQIDFNGNFEYFDLNSEVNIGAPSGFRLYQNYPNPFNPSTMINYDIPSDGIVSLKVFDLSGKEIAELVNEYKSAGYHGINFYAPDLASGAYYYTISVNNFNASGKMLIVK